MTTAPTMELNQIAELLIGIASSGMLLERLEGLCDRLGAAPARLYLADNETMTFYPVAAFGCESSDEELSSENVLLEPEPGQHVLYHGGDPVGMLVIGGQVEPQAEAHMLALLGPVLVSVQEHERDLIELRQTHERMSHLITAGGLLRHLDLDVLLVEIVQTTLKAVEAQVAAILTPDDDGKLIIRIAWGLREDHVDGICTSDGERVADVVFASGKPFMVTEEAVAERLDCSSISATVTGILCMPLTVSDRCLGVLLLGNPESSFTGDSQRLAQTVCDMAGMALDNANLVLSRLESERLGKELDIAQEVQKGMFPPDPLSVGQMSIAADFRCCDETGGDYYTYQERDGKLVAMIADVTGHGLGAALFTTAAHAILQQQLTSGEPLVPSLKTMNQGLYLTKSGRFMTGVLLEVDPDSGACTYYSAGHNPLLWIHEGEVRWLESQGMPLGIMSDLLEEEPAQIQFSPGDVLILYTDGFTEAFNPQQEFLGEDRFADIVLQGLEQSSDPAELVSHIFKSTDAWTDGEAQTDDLTLAVLRFDAA